MDSNDQFAYLQQFTYSRGSTKIKVASNSHSTQDFCLDLGTVRGRDGTNLHLYECVDVPQQQFYITDAGDDHIALEGESSDVRWPVCDSLPPPVFTHKWSSFYRRQPMYRRPSRERFYPRITLQQLEGCPELAMLRWELQPGTLRFALTLTPSLDTNLPHR